MPYPVTVQETRSIARELQTYTSKHSTAGQKMLAKGRIAVILTRAGVPEELHVPAAVEAEFRYAFPKEGQHSVATAMNRADPTLRIIKKTADTY